MFDQVKQLNKMRSQAKKLQSELSQIVEKVDYRGVTVKVTGDQKIDYIAVNGEEQKDITEAINRAMKQVQKKAAKKMMEMGGGLSGLLGGMK